MKLRIYADTSVIGGCFDTEFKDYSNRLIEEFKQGKKILAISDLTLKELENAPRKVQDVLLRIPDNCKEYLILDNDSKFLSNKYIDEEVIGPRFILDARHTAIATVNRVDVLISWNFQHIVNLKRIHLYNSINIKYGYPLIEIRSPREVLDET